jgi:hypothetical protein
VKTNLGLPPPTSKFYSLSFTIYPSQLSALFGYFTDVIVHVSPCIDIWGGIKLEAQSSTRLGLQDYGSNEMIIKDLFQYIEVSARIDMIQRSYVYCGSSN